MIDFLKGWGALLIATIALIQPWIIAIFRKVFLKGTIQIHETSQIEIGYSTFGETIGLHGTLVVYSKDQFVSNIELNVIKQRDNSCHSFDWGVFRSAKFNVGSGKDISFELPSGFLIATSQPHKYNIQFFDTQIQNEVRPHLIKLKEEFNKLFLNPELRQHIENIRQSPSSTESNQIVEQVFKDFILSDIGIKTSNKLERLLYWEAGEYTIEMRIKTFRPLKTFIKKWRFRLTEEESELLRRNCMGILFESTGRPSGDYNFAYVKYEPI